MNLIGAEYFDGEQVGEGSFGLSSSDSLDIMSVQKGTLVERNDGKGGRSMKDLMDVVAAVGFKGAVISDSDHPCFSGRRRQKAAMSVGDDSAGDDITDDSSADDSSSDDWDIMHDNCDDD